ncbi:MAG TPA: AMP-binding protein [Solirubrobacteraceae bacterium]|jgi:O-succinylbenzoic acid--CoA ligase|nr:AMP-binding protein [Solirubrobacteraceae bacterium]
MQVDAWLARAAARHPERQAVQTAAGALTYAQLHDRARGFAGWLAAQGVRRGDRIALHLPAGLDFAVALHGCLLRGAAAVPVDPRLSERERQQVAAGARLVLGAQRACSSPAEGRARDVAEGRDRAWHDLDAAAAVIHTSGTTGDPKPVELTYGNWLWSALGSAVALGLDPRERWLGALPVAHVGGLSILVRSAIYATTAVLHERFETEAVLDELMAPGGATLVSLVPTTLARLLDAGLHDPPRLRCALLGGAPVPTELVRRASRAGVAVSPTYGLTEACSQVTTAPAGDGAVVDAGPPLFCTRVSVAGDGEILVAGPTVAPGARAPDGWLHTGDLGALDERGRLRVTGRLAETIISGGENVAPAEVEAALLEHRAVADAAVYGRRDPQWGQAVVASVVVRDAGGVTAEELRAHCAERLAPYKVPKEVRFVDQLPRTPAGKLRRRELA